MLGYTNLQRTASRCWAYLATRTSALKPTESRLIPRYIYAARPFLSSSHSTMAIEVVPLPLPPSADASKFADFGREVKGVKPGELTPEQFKEVEELLYKVCASVRAKLGLLTDSVQHSALLFRDAELSPEQQFALTKAFDPTSESYGHGNNKTGETKKSILHPDLKTIPRVPQVQLIGNGVVYDHEGLAEAKLKHPHHRTFHKTHVPDEDDLKATRFYRWHIDAALYDLNPPKVTTLYGIAVPKGGRQVCRYDDGTGDELDVPLGTTAFVSGKTMFDILPPELKSLAVRSKVKYAPHPYVWMAPAHAKSTGLGIETEGLEMSWDELPPWEEAKIKVLPLVSAVGPACPRHVAQVCTALEEPCDWRSALPGSPLRRVRAARRSSTGGCKARGCVISRWCTPQESG